MRDDCDRVAQEVVMTYHGELAWGYDPAQNARLEQLIAAAIRSAVVEAVEAVEAVRWVGGHGRD